MKRNMFISMSQLTMQILQQEMLFFVLISAETVIIAGLNKREKLAKFKRTLQAFLLFFFAVSDCNSSDLTAERLGQSVNKFNDTGIFVRCCVDFDVVLEFLDKLG